MNSKNYVNSEVDIVETEIGGEILIICAFTLALLGQS